jgi:hypothetical protein
VLPGAFIALEIAGCSTTHGHPGADADDRLRHGNRAVLVPIHGDPMALRGAGHPSQVVLVGGRHAELHEPPVRRVDQAQLLTAIGRREPSGPEIFESEVAVERRRRSDVRDAERDRSQPVQRH